MDRKQPVIMLQSGVTLVELLVAVALSAITVLGLMRLLSGVTTSYDLQAQFSDVRQNAEYAMRFLSDGLMQLGADLPDSGLEIFTQANVGDDSIFFLANPGGGTHRFSSITDSTNKFKVTSANGFVLPDGRVPFVVVRRAERGTALEGLTLNTSMGIRGADTVGDTLYFTSSKRFYPGDAIYCYVPEFYSLRGTNLYHNSNLVAENIDSVAILFIDSTGLEESSHYVTSWSMAKFVSLTVRGRTERPVLHYRDKEHNDGYRRVTLQMKFRLRNK